MNILKSWVYDLDNKKYVGLPLKDAVLMFVVLFAGLICWAWLISQLF